MGMIFPLGKSDAWVFCLAMTFLLFNLELVPGFALLVCFSTYACFQINGMMSFKSFYGLLSLRDMLSDHLLLRPSLPNYQKRPANISTISSPEV